jgi:hypothetical protein
VKRERFEGVVLLGHKGAAVEVPFDPARRWSIPAKHLWHGRRGHAVRGEVNGAEFESSIVPRLKKFWVLLGDPILRSARVSAGDTVRIALEPSVAKGMAKRGEPVMAKAKKSPSTKANASAKKMSSRRIRT